MSDESNIENTEPKVTEQDNESPTVKIETSKEIFEELVGLGKGISNSLNILVSSLDDLRAATGHLAATDYGTRNWNQSVSASLPHSYRERRLDNAVEREGADWKQGVEYEDKLYSIVAPTYSKSSTLTGTAARAATRRAIGDVGNKIIQLPHSGIIIDQEGLTRGELFELNNYITSARVTLGMETNGRIFGNDAGLRYEAIIQHAFPKIQSHNVSNANPEDLLELMTVTDLDIYVHGVAAATYQNRIETYIPCTSFIDEEHKQLCSHTYKAMANIARMYHVDNSQLTRKQASMLANRLGKYTADQIKEYQSEFTFNNTVGLRRINDGMSLELKVPSVREYLEATSEWVADAIRRGDEQFTDRKSTDELRQYIENSGRLNPILQYSTWIKAIIIHQDTDDTEDQRIDDADDIKDNLEIMLSNDDLVKSVVDIIQDYINHCTVALIGFPIQKCPSCNQFLSGHRQYQTLHVIDPLSTFFTLARLKYSPTR